MAPARTTTRGHDTLGTAGICSRSTLPPSFTRSPRSNSARTRHDTEDLLWGAPGEAVKVENKRRTRRNGRREKMRLGSAQKSARATLGSILSGTAAVRLEREGKEQRRSKETLGGRE